jgi:hypothetical protein
LRLLLTALRSNSYTRHRHFYDKVKKSLELFPSLRVEQLFLCPYLSRGNAATYDETWGAICDSTLIVSYLGTHAQKHTAWLR